MFFYKHIENIAYSLSPSRLKVVMILHVRCEFCIICRQDSRSVGRAASSQQESCWIESRLGTFLCRVCMFSLSRHGFFLVSSLQTVNTMLGKLVILNCPGERVNVCFFVSMCPCNGHVLSRVNPSLHTYDFLKNYGYTHFELVLLSMLIQLNMYIQ